MSPKIVILSEVASFPWGMAASTRVRNLAKGFLSSGNEVKYVSLRGADCEKVEGFDYQRKGIYEGISYLYPGLSILRSKNWWIRRVDDCTSFIGVFSYLLKLRKNREIDVIVMYSMSNFLCKSMVRFAHFFDIPIVLEVCEWPHALVVDGQVSHDYAKEFCHETIPMMDGIIAISGYIEKRIKEICERRKLPIPIERVPILVDSLGPEVVGGYNKKDPYILYCGAIQYYDIAKFVVKLLSCLCAENDCVYLKFTGGLSGDLFQKLREYAKSQNVLDRIDFTGYLEENELLRSMSNASCLLAPLPESAVSNARFPTKIGFYLTSGAPVVTNGVGEIKEILIDKKNAYIVDDFDAQLFAKKVLEIVAEPDLAKIVGKEGQKTAREKFHFETACKNFGSFFEDVRAYRKKYRIK